MRLSKDYNTSLPTPAIGVVLGSALTLAAGSGVMQFSPNELQRVAYTTSVKNVVKQTYAKNLLPQQLNFIKTTFALSDDNLASVLGVVRKTLANWKSQGEIARDKSLERFFILHALAKDWQQLAYPKTREALLLPIVDNENVLGLLQKDVIDIERVLYFGRCLTRYLASDMDLY